MAAMTKSYAKFCSFCFHSKRPEQEFSSHWVKDKKDGTVTCPLLLQNECGYCHEKGHTPKFCPRLASREQRRKEHAKRMSNCCPVVTHGMHGMHKVHEQIAEKENKSIAQKRARARCNDNQYAELMGAEDHECKRNKLQKTKAAPVWNGPKVTAPRPPQGVWGNVAKAAAAVKDLSKGEVEQLKVLLGQLGITNDNTAEEQAWLDAQVAKNSQTEEETAEGEAFFDNVADTEDAVIHIAHEQPDLVRNFARGNYDLEAQPDEEMRDEPTVMMPVPLKPARLQREYTTPGKRAYAEGATREEAWAIDAGIVLPPECNLDKDFGEAGDDGWGSE